MAAGAADGGLLRRVRSRCPSALLGPGEWMVRWPGGPTVRVLPGMPSDRALPSTLRVAVVDGEAVVVGVLTTTSSRRRGRARPASAALPDRRRVELKEVVARLVGDGAVGEAAQQGAERGAGRRRRAAGRPGTGTFEQRVVGGLAVVAVGDRRRSPWPRADARGAAARRPGRCARRGCGPRRP